MEAIWRPPEGLYWLAAPEIVAPETRDSRHKNPNPNPLKKLTKISKLEIILLKILVCFYQDEIIQDKPW